MIKASNNPFECSPVIINPGGSGFTPVNIDVNPYNGISVTVPDGFILTRIKNISSINLSNTGIVTGTDLVITDGFLGDVYLVEGYTP